jgi:CRISPR-associated protein (TIGR02584 family)
MRRRILIVTGGMSPAIVTETIWALGAVREPAFWPDRVFVVVTAGALERCRTSLLGPAGKLALLSRDLKRPSLASATEIVPTACTDIRTEEDAIAFGDAVCAVVQRETRDEDAVVHLSLAGGRKTMSFHGGAAMTLFGRPHDELSHVLVHPASLERPDADFWWPGHNQPGEIELSLIPFVRVRGRLPRAMLEQRMDYAGYVAQVNAATEGTVVVLKLLTETSTLSIAGGAVCIRLEPQDFIVYRVLAEWAKAAVVGAGPNGVGDGHRGWITLDMLRNPQSYRPSPIHRVVELGGSPRTYSRAPSANDKTANSAFRQAVSRVRKAIGAAVADQVLANRLLSEPSGGRGGGNPSRFGLLLSPHEVVIRAREDGPEIAPFALTAKYAGDE